MPTSKQLRSAKATSRLSKSNRPVSQPAPPSNSPSLNAAFRNLHHPDPAFPNISARWLLAAGLTVAAGALILGWLTLCLIYWQGSWQLLYHPTQTISLTPASVGLSFETIHFAATETGQTQLTGWWIPGNDPARTLLYLHGANGNLSDTVDTLANLHQQNVNIFAIDYRGYGQPPSLSQSQPRPTRPSEKQLRQDAEWALTYLTLTRHIDSKHIVIYGTLLGANVALELAADHNELAGVILDQPLTNPMAPLFQDSRSHLVPAHALVTDTYDLAKAAKTLQIPSLWLIALPEDRTPATAPSAYNQLTKTKAAAFLNAPIQSDPNYKLEIKRYLDDLKLTE